MGTPADNRFYREAKMAEGAVLAERERCQKVVDAWLSGPTMVLRAGEMTTQEKRTALAIVASISNAIRNP